ncbi:M4 family metallopeptidase [uncultured Aquimarina sp.]|uniref:M4 family metallopeptidase n=1 Tax=uncultured Aquimarina sp. TaxID=575652 RepID=UPI0026216595|nr:M4 family metallopeptidase [uncultured Aquimarina sp.]
MKFKTTLKTVLSMVLVFSSALVNAQNTQKSIAKLKQQANAVLTINENSGLTEFVRFPAEKTMQVKGATLEQKTINFLEDFKSLYNIKSVENSLVIEKTKKDNYGLDHVILKQQYNGIPVYGGELRFHFDLNKNITSINGKVVPNIKLNTTPTLSISESNSIALSAIRSQGLNKSGAELKVNKNTLYIYQKGLIKGDTGALYLVYHIEVRNDNDVREYVFINAHTGEIVEQITGMAHALDRVLYEENTSNLVWQEGDAFPGILDQWQQTELAAAEHTYNFFKNAFGYLSYDGQDAQMITINNNPNISCPNANWNGVSANYCTGTAADDVVAHEWGHAYTEYTSNLIYAYESGAINESFSDIWGETIDLLNDYQDEGEDVSLRTGCDTSLRWMMGEDASAFGGAIRDMWNPNCEGDPGKVIDFNYLCGTADSGGVHINSGIPNHMYALLVDGGTFNGQTINAIGLTKAAHIFWRAQSNYLTLVSNFANLADAIEASATDLIGTNLEGLSTTAPVGASGEIITAADVLEVEKAILAVELRTPNNCGYQPLLSNTGTVLCDNASTNAIFFEDWETGTDGWTMEQLPENASDWESRDWAIESSLPEGREGKSIFGTDPINGDCRGNFQNGIIRLQSPVINIPAVAEGGIFELAFNHLVATEATWDGGNIKYSLDGGPWTLIPSEAFTENPYNNTLKTAAEGNDNPLQSENAFTGADEGSNTGSWGRSLIDLSSIGVNDNSTIQFRFEMGTDGCNGLFGWYIDEIMLFNCAQTTLSVADNEFISKNISVYPIPSNGIVNLRKLTNINLIKAEIYDINGRMLKTINLSDVTVEKAIDISNLTRGVYFMSVTTENIDGVIRIVKE